MILAHLMLGFVQGGRGGKGFGDGLALNLASEAVIGAMAPILRLMTVAVGIPAPSARGGDRTGSQVPQLGDLALQLSALLFQLRE